MVPFFKLYCTRVNIVERANSKAMFKFFHMNGAGRELFLCFRSSLDFSFAVTAPKSHLRCVRFWYVFVCGVGGAMVAPSGLSHQVLA